MTQTHLSHLFPTLLFCGLFAAFFADFSIQTIHAQAQNLCHTIQSGQTAPNGFGPPYKPFTTEKELFIQVSCYTTSANVTAGTGSSDEYIYRQGYEWKNGGWRLMQFNGVNRAGEWIVGTANAQVSRTQAEMAQENFVVAYICTRHQNSWKCGCQNAACNTPSWQVQTFKQTAQQPVLPTPIERVPVDYLAISGISKYVGTYGDTITLSGYNFSLTKNTVHFFDAQSNQHTIENVPAQSANSLRFIVPQSVPSGAYTVTLSNQEKGLNRDGILFVLAAPGAQAPVLSKVTPSRGTLNQEVVLEGSGFLPQGNIVYASYGLIRNLNSPDGKTLRFTVRPPFAMGPDGKIPQGAQAYAIPLQLLVVNKNGMSNTQLFTFTNQ